MVGGYRKQGCVSCCELVHRVHMFNGLCVQRQLELFVVYAVKSSTKQPFFSSSSMSQGWTLPSKEWRRNGI